MHQRFSLTQSLVWMAWVFIELGGQLVAQNPAQDHAGQYPQADIVYGSRLYSAQCSSCHGPNGDAVDGVNLGSGRFRNAATDQDVTRLITTGLPGAGMPPFKFNSAELAGIIAYLRNMNSFDARSVTLGDADRGRVVFEGKGGCMTVTASTEQAAGWRPT